MKHYDNNKCKGSVYLGHLAKTFGVEQSRNYSQRRHLHILMLWAEPPEYNNPLQNPQIFFSYTHISSSHSWKSVTWLTFFILRDKSEVSA